MATRYYVSLDRDGIEHNAEGDIRWALPSSPPHETAPQHVMFELRAAAALLDVLDERIYEAEPLELGELDSSGVLRVRAARLTRQTGWDAERAAAFAIDCAKHVLGPDGDVSLPDGTTFANVLEEARAHLETTTGSQAGHLGAVARLFALHRLRKERRELGDMASELIEEDLARDVDALDDPSYEALEPLIDAVLAAIAALRHHALIRLPEAEEEKEEERFEHKALERQTPLRIPTPVVTPWGAVEVGGTYAPRYSPAWAEARDAARHARRVANAAGGASAEERERGWQAEALEAVLWLS